MQELCCETAYTGARELRSEVARRHEAVDQACRGDGVGEEAGDGHGPDATRDRRDPAGNRQRGGIVDVADEAGLALTAFRGRDAVDADVDHGGARLDPVALD